MEPEQTFRNDTPLARPWKEQSFADMLDDTAARYPDKDALVFYDDRYTYREFQNIVTSTAKGLIELGVQRGDHIGLLLGNCPEFIFAQFAANKIGAVVVPINTRFKVTELEYILHQGDVSTLISHDLFLGKIDYMAMISEICPELARSEPGKLQAARLPKLRNVIVHSLLNREYPGTIHFRELQMVGRNIPDAELEARQSAVNVFDTTLILYTSGTTGYPKGAMLNQWQLLRQIQTASEDMDLTDNEVIFNPNPFFHNLGNADGILLSVLLGAKHVFTETFDTAVAMEIMARERCTMFGGYSAFFVMVLDHPDLPKYDLKATLRTGFCGFAGVREPLALLQQIYDQLGLRDLNPGYGMSETSSRTTGTVVGDPPEVIAYTVGRLCPGFEVALINPETGRCCGPGEHGEMWVRGPMVMKGYYNKPAETAAALDANGWFHTKDILSRDADGIYRFHGRMSEMIKVGGENVDPLEVERYLCTHPKVKLAQVTSIPDRRLGDVPIAFVQLEPDQLVNEGELMDFCKGRIATFKVPRYIRFVSEFPITPSGKIQKYVLRDQAINDLGLQAEK